VVGVDDSVLKVDLNHPLVDTPVQLSATVLKVMEKIDERGGTSNDWIQTVMDGPGMQARVNGQPTDFFSEDPFSRTNIEPDTIFYSNPRMVTHIDETAIYTVMEIYKNLLEPGTEILDLMSSWKSHLPEDIRFKKVIGLGMNAEEMTANSQLTDHVVYDLNDHSKLPFEGNAYDAVICTVSVEYLTQPFKVFEEVARILRPNGKFIVTFSNRWFPPKVVKIWQELHEFERMGLVTEYFLKSGQYENIHTISRRGLKRPENDKYYSQNPISDPVYCVYGSKKE
jgi:SAM-dependent methyltransferase